MARSDAMPVAEPVERLQVTDANSVCACDTRQRFSPLDNVVGIPRLAGMAGRGRDRLEALLKRAVQLGSRHFKVESSWDPFVPAPHAGAKGWIGCAERIERNIEGLGNR